MTPKFPIFLTILLAFGQARLSGARANRLKGLAAQINPGGYERIRMTGYPGRLGPSRSNLASSEGRAPAEKHYRIGLHLSPNSITAEVKGKPLR